MDAAVEAAVMALADTLVVPLDGWGKPMQPGWLSPANAQTLASVALTAAYPAIRADIAAEVLAPIEALIETDGVFLKKDTKIKRVQEDRRRDLGAIVTTSMVTVDDIRAALSTAKEASE